MPNIKGHLNRYRTQVNLDHADFRRRKEAKEAKKERAVAKAGTQTAVRYQPLSNALKELFSKRLQETQLPLTSTASVMVAAGITAIDSKVDSKVDGKADNKMNKKAIVSLSRNIGKGVYVAPKPSTTETVVTNTKFSITP